MKKKRIGFYNPMTQRLLAKRPRKKRKMFSKNMFIQAALKKGFVLKHLKTQQILIVQPNRFLNMTEVIHFLMLHPQMQHKKKA